MASYAFNNPSAEQQTAIIEWLTANGVEAARVPLDAFIGITEDTLTVDVFEGLSRQRTRISVPLLVPLPELPALRSLDACPTCGRAPSFLPQKLAGVTHE